MYKTHEVTIINMKAVRDKNRGLMVFPCAKVQESNRMTIDLHHYISLSVLKETRRTDCARFYLLKPLEHLDKA